MIIFGHDSGSKDATPASLTIDRHLAIYRNVKTLGGCKGTGDELERFLQREQVTYKWRLTI